MASPNYEKGLEKQTVNAEKTRKNAQKRKEKDFRSKPQYKKSLSNLQRKHYSDEQLLKIIDNPNTNEIYRIAAFDLLEKITSSK